MTEMMTVGQQGLWFLSRMDMSVNAAYNVILAFRTAGLLDENILQQAYAELCAEHPLLRSRVTVEYGQPKFSIEAEGKSAIVVVQGELDEVAHAESATPFQLEQGPLCRLTLVRSENGMTGLVVAIPHLIFDGASAHVFMSDLAAIYTRFAKGPDVARPPGAPWAPSSHGEVESAFLASQKGRDSIVQQANRLKDIPRTPIFQNKTTSENKACYDASSCSAELPAALVQQVKQFAVKNGSTPAVVYLLALQALIWQYGRRDDFAISVPFSSRDEACVAAIGYLVNIGVVRASIDGQDDLHTLLDALSDQFFDLMDARHIPFPSVVRAIGEAGAGMANDLMQISFSYQKSERSAWSFDGIEARALHVRPRFIKSKLKLEIDEHEQGARCQLDVDTGSIDAATANRMLSHFVPLLEAIVEHKVSRVADLPTLSAAEQQHMLIDWNDTAAAWPGGKRCEELFEAQVQQTPDSVALVCGQDRLSYRQLDDLADRLAAVLARAGVAPDTRVAMYLERGMSQVVAMLAIAKSKGAYVPIDPANPPERSLAIIQDSRAIVVVTHSSLRERLPATCTPVIYVDACAPEESTGGGAVRCMASPAHLSYCIYTSGSTGQPKGVMIQGDSLTNLIGWHIHNFGTGPEDRVVQFANIAFDASTWEIWGTLCSGAALYLLPHVALSPAELTQFVRENKISVAFLPTPVFESCVSQQALEGTSLRLVLVGGDRLHSSVSTGTYRLVNNYGPTETTVVATSSEVVSESGSAPPPIGTPIANARAYVLNEYLSAVAPGVLGELYIAGSGVARGYLSRPALTGERFLPDPFGPPGSRMYKTGDQVRYQGDGQIEFLCRLDDQIKLRGYRIEPAEIEQVLLRHEAVRENVVLLQGETPESRQLTAYIVLHDGVQVTTEMLCQHAASSLPAYMVPSAWVVLPELPFTRNGKLDTSRLPLPDASASKRATAYAAPRSANEQMVVDIWQEVLRSDSIGLNDNFFSLGGHSLLATQIVARVGERVGKSISLRSLFDNPTVEQFAARVAELVSQQTSASAALPAIRPRAKTGHPPGH